MFLATRFIMAKQWKWPTGLTQGTGKHGTVQKHTGYCTGFQTIVTATNPNLYKNVHSTVQLGNQTMKQCMQYKILVIICNYRNIHAQGKKSIKAETDYEKVISGFWAPMFLANLHFWVNLWWLWMIWVLQLRRYQVHIKCRCGLPLFFPLELGHPRRPDVPEGSLWLLREKAFLRSQLPFFFYILGRNWLSVSLK